MKINKISIEFDYVRWGGATIKSVTDENGEVPTRADMLHVIYLLQEWFPEPCFMYIGTHVDNAHLIKVGITNDPDKRAKSLRINTILLVRFYNRFIAKNHERDVLKALRKNHNKPLAFDVKNKSEWVRIPDGFSVGWYNDFWKNFPIDKDYGNLIQDERELYVYSGYLYDYETWINKGYD